MNRKTLAIVALLVTAAALTRHDAPARPPEVPTAGASSNAVPPAAARRVEEWTITVHQAPFHCPPCNRLKPELVKLREAGWTVNVVTGEAASYPTVIMRCGEREHKRASGYVDAVTIADWPNDNKKANQETQSQSMRAGRMFRIGCWSCR